VEPDALSELLQPLLGRTLEVEPEEPSALEMIGDDLGRGVVEARRRNTAQVAEIAVRPRSSGRRR
jgi:hypothetical protein